jgi:hypothetical protein
MSFHVFFSFSWCLAKTLTVPAGTKQQALDHVNEVQRLLNLKLDPPGEGNIKAYGELYPSSWNMWKLADRWKDIPDERLCETVEKHNRWVRSMYEDFGQYAETPFVAAPFVGTEQLTPADAREFWHGLTILDVPVERWTREYYRARMEALYETMRGRPEQGMEFDAKRLTQQQANAVIRLFEQYLDLHDLGLEVVQRPGRGFKGLDVLASSYDGGYDYCDGCYKSIDPDSIGDCKRRNCPLKRELA